MTDAEKNRIIGDIAAERRRRHLNVQMQRWLASGRKRTKTEFAEKLGISLQYLRQFVIGDRKVNDELADKLEKLMELPAEHTLTPIPLDGNYSMVEKGMELFNQLDDQRIQELVDYGKYLQSRPPSDGAEN